MKHILVTGQENVGNTICYPCFQEDVENRVRASVVVEDLPYLPSEGELLPEDRTVYGLCATHAESEQLVP